MARLILAQIICLFVLLLLKILMYRIRQKFRGRKISPKARALYWDKNFTEFNFTNSSRPRQEVVGGFH